MKRLVKWILTSVFSCVIVTTSFFILGCRNNIDKGDSSNYSSSFNEQNNINNSSQKDFTSQEAFVVIYNAIVGLTEYGKTLSEIIIPDSIEGVEITVIHKEAFANCSNLKSVNIGSSVINIGSSAFENCTNLKSVIIGNNVTNVGALAFNDCENLNTVTIGNNVTYIGNSAFSKCKSLTNLVVPNSVICIGAGAFSDCYNIKSVIFEKTRGWYRCSSANSMNSNATSSEAAGSVEINKGSLENATIAAFYLTDHFAGSYWIRKVK